MAGGVTTTTDDLILSLSLSTLPSNDKFLFISLLYLFLSAHDLVLTFPIAFLSAVLLFSFVNSSIGTFTTPSLAPAPFQSPSN